MPLIPHDVRWAFVGAGNSSSCPEIATGRTAIPPLASKDTIPLYDVSLCNIMGMGTEYLYVPHLRMVYVIADPVGIPALLILSVLIVVIMVIMGHNLQVIMRKACCQCCL
jgi:hypothetical protein